MLLSEFDRGEIIINLVRSEDEGVKADFNAFFGIVIVLSFFLVAFGEGLDTQFRDG